MRLKASLAGLGALVLALAAGCITSNRQAGRGSEVENELGVYGALVDEHGQALAGAKVKVFPGGSGLGKSSATSSRSDSDSTITDGEGRYAFLGLDSGEYNLFGDYKSGSLVLLRTGIALNDTGISLDLGVDTLRPPGRIRGRLLLGDQGKGAVFCFIPGTSYLAVSDDSGRFALTGVPQGKYSVGYVAAGFLIAPDTGVVVRSALTTNLPDKRLEYDPALPPPPPTGLRATYDTLAERVTLSWDAVPVSDLAGFVVYRDDPSFPDPIPLRNGFTARTDFRDSAFDALAPGEKRILIYRVKAKDLGANVSAAFSPPVQIEAVSRKWATTELSLATPALPGRETTLGDSVGFVLAFANPTRRTVGESWWLEGDSLALRKHPDSLLSGSDTLVWVPSSLGRKRIRVEASDEAGTGWSAAYDLDVVLDAPIASAGRDTALTPFDSLELRGSGTDRLGRIVAWAWDVGGNGPFRDAPEGRLAIRLPGEPGRFRCVLRVKDDDGNTAYDTLMVDVIRDLPIAIAKGDTTVSVNDLVILWGTGRDSAGFIAKREWDIGGTGTFVPAPETSFVFKAGPDPIPRLPCVLRVTDDDGGTALDTVYVAIVKGPPTARAGNDTVVTLNDAIRLHARGSDSAGTVVKWEWDVGATGKFSPAGPETTVTAPAIANPAYPCILKVTDDDGNTAYDTMTVTVLADPPRARAGSDTAVSIGDQVRLHGNGFDSSGAIVKREWSIGGAVFVPAADTFFTFEAGMAERESTLCVLRVTDDDGQADQDTVILTVLQDPPRAFAGADTVLTIKDSLRLTGRGSDRFGRIVRWEWKAGPAGSFEIGGPTRDLRLPDTASGSYPIVLRVTDDDGNEALDTVSVEVLLDAPKAVLRGDGRTDVFIGDSFRISTGLSRDSLGKIVKKEIRLGASPYIALGAEDTTLTVPSWQVGTYFLYLKVTDDDGNQSLDSIPIRLHKVEKWVKLLDPSPFPERTAAEAVWFKDSLWLIGGWSERQSFLGDVWKSADGSAWVQVQKNGPRFSELSQFGAAVFNDRIWVVAGQGPMGQVSGVWSSADGVHWDSVTAPGFSPRASPSLAVFQGRMWLIGGFTKQGIDWLPTSEVWSSADGKIWTLETSHAEFGPRGNSALAVYDGSLWLFGNESGAADVWKSGDGRSWRSVATSAPFGLYPECGIHGGEMWVIAQGATWRTTDGLNWIEGPAIGAKPRTFPAMAGSDSDLWIIGGNGNYVPGVSPNEFPDVWRTE